MKNIQWDILGFQKEMELDERWMGHLGESQGHAKVTSPFELILKNSKPRQMKANANQVRKKREGKNQAVTCKKGRTLSQNL